MSSSLSKLSKALVAVCALSVAAPFLQADEVSAFGGLLRGEKAKEGEASVYPLPAKHMSTIRKDWSAFVVKDVTTNETFNMSIYPHYPVTVGAQPAPVTTIENDGKNYIVPIDLHGRGLSDLMIGRQGWGGWRVYTNGQALAEPVNGFVEGLYNKGKKGEEKLQSQLLAMDLSDLQVDLDLLGCVGDFLGNGTEQLVYFRPQWTTVFVVGAHGKQNFEADLKGIEPDRGGDRHHYLIPFKGSKAGERTRFAYYRHGVGKMLVFSFDGARFNRTEEDVSSHWKELNQYSPNPL